MAAHEQDGPGQGSNGQKKTLDSREQQNQTSTIGHIDSARSSDGGGQEPRTMGDVHGTQKDHARKTSATPSLSIDTRATTTDTSTVQPFERGFPMSPKSPESSLSVRSKLSPATAPVHSPRSRDRGFSLRRAILAGKVQSPERGSVMELHEVGSSSTHGNPRHSNSERTPSKNSAAQVTVLESLEDEESRSECTKKTDASASLPNYEKWLDTRKGRWGPLVRLSEFKETVRKTLLGIHELPPSKDGRHIDLDIGRTKVLIDERRGQAYIDNTIRSSRYSLWNFLPRQLFAQFSKLANFYFLCVSILQMIPGLSTTGTFTTIVPLSFFVTISMAKEGYDDLRRYRLDKAENTRTVSVLYAHRSGYLDPNDGNGKSMKTTGSKQWVQKDWKDVRVGDVIKLERDEPAPADLVLLQATGSEGAAYVETMALDGEMNLKKKWPSPPLARACRSLEDLAQCEALFVVEDPNLDLYKFDGKVTLGEETLPLTNDDLIYRGSVLRNTREVLGMVIYSGEECKIRMNSTKNPRIKAPALQGVVNRVVVIIVVFVIALAVFNTAAYQVWRESYEEHAWYLHHAAVPFFPILTSFIILFNTMIPLSLYVSLEIIKLFQILFMNDIEMYDVDSNTPMEPRTSTINEELGQINYIFSDKTGTLTNNTMNFRKISVAGTAWLHDSDLKEEAVKAATHHQEIREKQNKGKRPIRRKLRYSTSEDPKSSAALSSPVLRSDSTASRWNPPARPLGSPQVLGTADLLRYVHHRPHTLFAQKVRLFLLSLSLCHTCFPEHGSDGKIKYQAASPDEQALVRAAQELGYIVVERRSGTITVKTFPLGHESEPLLETYQILNVIEFSSARKRMSVIVRMPNQRIAVFCKGADSTIMQLLRLSDLAVAKAVEIEQRVGKRQSLEAREVIRRNSEAQSRTNSIGILGMSVLRSSMGGIGRSDMNVRRLQPIRDEVDGWLKDKETDIDVTPRGSDSLYYSPRPSAHLDEVPRQSSASHGKSQQVDGRDELVEEAMVVDDGAVFERCFQHVNDFAKEGLRTLLYGYRYMEEDEYDSWRKLYLDASTSFLNRQEQIEKAGAVVEQNFELVGATAIEDRLQDGVPESIDKLRRAKIKLWMLTGDKRETAINIGHSCRLIKDYSTVTVLDVEAGNVSQHIVAATLDITNGPVAHSVVVVDGKTLGHITALEPLRELFLTLAVLVDTVICCRASPSQKASLVHSIRRKVNHAITLAIGDGANDIAMIQEAHVGIGITGKEGLQAARCSDYSIAQFRFLTKLLLVHGRWNYIRTCKYTLSTFWKEMLFYLTQALFQRYAGYTGTSLYESWSLSMFNTLFTSLPVIFMGIFEQDLSASTLMAVPELYHSLGPKNRGFNIPLYLGWVAMAASNAVIIFFVMLGLFGQSLFTEGKDLFAMGDLTFTACIIVIAAKCQFWEIHNKTATCAIAMFLAVGGWFLWNLILSSVYTNNVIYDVKDGLLQRFGKNALWWLTLILCIAACWVLETGVKTILNTWWPTDADCFRALEKDNDIRLRFEKAAALGSGHRRELTTEIESVRPMRTAEEDRQREGEVQKLLDRPRNMKAASGSDEQQLETFKQIRRRRTSEVDPDQKASFAEVVRSDIRGDDDGDVQGKAKARKRSIDVHNLFKKGFGDLRRSLDIV